jgi:membrane protease YdiL (CAAX protease family)
MPADRGAAAAVLVLTTIVIAVPLMPAGALVPAGLAILAVTAVAWHRRASAPASLGLLFSTCALLAAAGVGPQQAVFAIAFVVYAVVVRRVSWLRPAAAWLRRGVFDRTAVALGAAVLALSAAALLSWYVALEPDLTDLVRTFVPPWPLWLLVPGAVLLALVNAATEEAAYRGVLLEALDTALGPAALALVLQAAAFGALHFRGGFPRGWIGVGLAAVYGLMLGAVRRRTNGLLAPFVVHVLTDLVIFTIVLTLASRH